MDFVERWFGVAPDGGNGALELLWLLLPLAAGAVAWRAHRRARHVG